MDAKWDTFPGPVILIFSRKTSLSGTFANRCYQGFGKCNGFWLIALSWDLNEFWNKLRIWEYPLCWNPNGRAIDYQNLNNIY